MWSGGIGNLRAESSGTMPRAKSVIFIMLPGGPSQHDTFDPKPDAPAEVRGDFGTIATAIAGVRFCEHLPKLAARTDRFALIRSLSHQEANHFPATHKALTGHAMPRQLPGDAVNSRSRHDWPCYAAALSSASPSTNGIPRGISLPHTLVGGGVVWPGQHAGFLGSRFDPWQLEKDPSAADFREESLVLPAGINLQRISQREDLLGQIQAEQSALRARSEVAALSAHRSVAVDLLTSGKVSAAFEINRESQTLRDGYGRHSFGQSLLLARRLVEAGVGIVQANMGPVQTWDTHEEHFPRMRSTLLPQIDQALSALLDDLDSRGLLSQTLVLMLGEFGRTPKISLVPGATYVGRNHWPQVYTGLFAGAGVCGGKIIGSSDPQGAFPTSQSYSPDDVGTTILASLGLSLDTEMIDMQNRPVRACSGAVIEALYRG